MSASAEPRRDFATALADSPLMLAEGSMYERLRRSPEVRFDPDIAHASLIYDPVAARILTDVHEQYLAEARRIGAPMLLLTSTWRAGRDRLARSAFAGRPVNQDNAAFSLGIRDAPHHADLELFIGGNLGPRGDAYRPEESPSLDEAIRYHAIQAEALAEGGVDVLLAMTLPAFEEARGMAKAMAATGLPYLVSFVVRDTGTLLDGTPLAEAIDRIDDESDRAPLGYWTNCIHPRILEAALEQCPPATIARIVGLKANTSAKRPEELDGSLELHTADPQALGSHMRRIRDRFGLTLLGGCCGTGTAHLHQIATQCGDAS